MANVPGDIEDPFGVPPRQQDADRGNAVAQWYDSVREAPEWRYIFTDIVLKGSCALYYFFCTWFTDSFIINFVAITVLIVTEFWFTKNIGGRRLTGMRWWQVPSSTGSESTWRFEHRALEQPNFQASKIAVTQFWVGMIVLELFWMLMAVFTIKNPGYLILCGMAFSFIAMNLLGYYKCRSWSSQQLKQAAPESNFMSGMPGISGLPTGAASAIFQNALGRI